VLYTLEAARLLQLVHDYAALGEHGDLAIEEIRVVISSTIRHLPHGTTAALRRRRAAFQEALWTLHRLGHADQPWFASTVVAPTPQVCARLSEETSLLEGCTGVTPLAGSLGVVEEGRVPFQTKPELTHHTARRPRHRTRTDASTTHGEEEAQHQATGPLCLTGAPAPKTVLRALPDTVSHAPAVFSTPTAARVPGAGSLDPTCEPTPPRPDTTPTPQGMYVANAERQLGVVSTDDEVGGPGC
jgi:hypothetical protein